LAQQVQSGELQPDQVDESRLAAALSFSDLPEPDLFIRTGGEKRISNFLLWQCAYTELYFTDILWPDFDSAALDAALADFFNRQRRFGRTGEQVRDQAEAS
jgi:undecaprenyl diphosphate synthase